METETDVLVASRQSNHMLNVCHHQPVKLWQESLFTSLSRVPNKFELKCPKATQIDSKVNEESLLGRLLLWLWLKHGGSSRATGSTIFTKRILNPMLEHISSGAMPISFHIMQSHSYLLKKYGSVSVPAIQARIRSLLYLTSPPERI